MAKMLSRTSGLVHPKTAIETTIKIDDVSAALQITMVPAKSQLAFAAIMVITNAMITAGALTSNTTTETHQVPVGKIIDLGIHGHTTYHPRNS
jgi:hypothetical protein